ncbi:allantoinase AllB [Pseudogracilibacillus sp. SE30717A]|uniref:allantoinase AllB n=1 Tax=Pseudogracilibacillus sp. SE30717A TaxID=3098293 RepID=UPI00300E566C
MRWDHIIRNGEIVTPSATYTANIYIKDGKIAAINEEELNGDAKEITDASGLHILPGLIDTHVHSRDGGATYKEDFYHSTQAAAAGGITTIFEMPNTNPTINTVENFKKQVNNLQSKAHVNFGIWGICLGDLNNKDLLPLTEAGVIGFKYFWGYAVNKNTFQLVYNYSEDMVDVIAPCDDGQVFEMFEEVAKTGRSFGIHAENSDLINHLTKQLEQKDADDYNAFLASRPNLAEELTIQTGIAMAKQTGARLHILHVSTAEGVKLIREAQQEGYPITAETCPHYLFLTNEDYREIGPVMKVYPLVKFKKDQEAIWEGINDGTISFVCSDHAPHTSEEKDGDLWTIPAGMCGVETLAPLMLNAVSEGKITLQQLVALLSENPAKQFDVYPQKGTIQVGSDADITIVNLNKRHVIKTEDLHSKSKITAYDGFEITGMPVQTIVNGTTVMKNGDIIFKPLGELVTPK